MIGKCPLSCPLILRVCNLGRPVRLRHSFTYKIDYMPIVRPHETIPQLRLSQFEIPYSRARRFVWQKFGTFVSSHKSVGYSPQKTKGSGVARSADIQP